MWYYYGVNDKINQYKWSDWSSQLSGQWGVGRESRFDGGRWAWSTLYTLMNIIDP